MIMNPIIRQVKSMVPHYTEYKWENVITFWLLDGMFHVASTSMPEGNMESRRRYAEVLAFACNYMSLLGEEEKR